MKKSILFYVLSIGLLVTLVVIFLSKPILNIQNYYYSPANIGQFFTLTKTGFESSNVELGDVFQQMHSWMIFNTDSFQRGEFPLWNPYNGFGVPQLANYQSAVFSLYSLPFYLFEFRYATLFSVALKLVGCSLFTFLFLRQHNLPLLSAILGAIAFTYCGYNMLWLQWQHSSVLPSLPASLYFVNLIIRQRPRITTIWGLFLSLLIGLLAGHPETFYSILLVICAYSLYILFRDCKKRSELLHKAALLITIGILAALAGAIQVIPFIEYAHTSGALNHRSSEGSGGRNDLAFWPLFMYPDLLGNPSIANYYFPQLHNTTYVFTNTIYVGGLVVFLALYSISLLKYSKDTRFWWGIAIIYLFYCFRPIDIGVFINLIPGLSYIPVERSTPIHTFTFSILAAYGFNLICNPTEKLIKQLLRQGLLGVGLFVFVTIGAYMLLKQFFGADLDGKWLQSWNTDGVSRQLGLGISFIFALLIIITAQFIVNPFYKKLLLIIIPLLVFYQTGLFMRHFVPITSNSAFFPNTQQTQALQANVKNNYLAMLCKQNNSPGLIPDTNIAYKIRTPFNFDVMDTVFSPKLLSHFLDSTQSCVQEFNLKGFQIMGIRYILMPDDLAKDISPSEYINKTLIASNLNLYELKDIPSRYHIVDQVEYIDDNKDILLRLGEASFNPSTTVVISGINKSPFGDATHTSDLLDQQQNIRIIEERNNQVKLDVQTNLLESWLVITTSYYPGWKAYVNEQEVPVIRANYAFNAIPLPLGKSHVVFKYDPLSFKIGGLISLLSLLIMMLFSIFAARQNKSTI